MLAQGRKLTRDRSLENISFKRAAMSNSSLPRRVRYRDLALAPLPAPAACCELRVLKPGGRLLLADVGRPSRPRPIPS